MSLSFYTCIFMWVNFDRNSDCDIVCVNLHTERTRAYVDFWRNNFCNYLIIPVDSHLYQNVQFSPYYHQKVQKIETAMQLLPSFQ